LSEYYWNTLTSLIQSIIERLWGDFWKQFCKRGMLHYCSAGSDCPTLRVKSRWTQLATVTSCDRDIVTGDSNTLRQQPAAEKSSWSDCRQWYPSIVTHSDIPVTATTSYKQQQQLNWLQRHSYGKRNRHLLPIVDITNSNCWYQQFIRDITNYLVMSTIWVGDINN